MRIRALEAELRANQASQAICAANPIKQALLNLLEMKTSGKAWITELKDSSSDEISLWGPSMT